MRATSKDWYHEFKRNGITINRPPNPKVDAPSHSHGHAPPPAPKPVQQQQSTQTNRMPMIIGGVVVGLILLGVIGMSLFSNNNNDPDAQNTLVAQENRIASLEAQTQAVADLVEQQETLMFISTLTAEALASATEPATNTPTDVPIYLGPVTNNDWTPYERDFDGVTMVLVPSGEFTFGASQAQLDANIAVCREKLNESSCEALRDELNGRTMIIDEPYWIDKYEVSQAQYGSSSSDNPQVDVTSEQAQAFCQARDASLPSEAQWEFAAKGPEGWRYPWGETWDLSIVRSNICDANCTENWREANYDDGYARLSPVNEIHGSESWIGAWNMVGNVWEWTSDVYSDETTNVLRGGAWTWIQAESTTTSRAAGIAASTSFYGFRCVRPYRDGDLNP
ncbi:MAG: formylglycine-generating enzyme family protein [Chloroflexota bacterium]